MITQAIEALNVPLPLPGTFAEKDSPWNAVVLKAGYENSMLARRMGTKRL